MYRQSVTPGKTSHLFLMLAMSVSLAVGMTGCGGGGVSSVPDHGNGASVTGGQAPVTGGQAPVTGGQTGSGEPATDDAPTLTDTVRSSIGADSNFDGNSPDALPLVDTETPSTLDAGNHGAPIFEYLEDAVRAKNTGIAMAKVYEASPNLSGAPTQSMNYDGNSVTTDSVSVSPESASDGYRFSLSKTGDEPWSFSASEGIRGDPISSNSGGYTDVDRRKGISDGTLYVNSSSNIDDILQFTGIFPRNEPGGLGANPIIGEEGAYPTVVGQTRFTSSLNGERGLFVCSSNPSTCKITDGQIKSGTWMFAPLRPGDSVDVAVGDTIHWSGPFKLVALPGMRNGETGYFTCLSRQCGRGSSSSLNGHWVFNSASLVSGAEADYLSFGVWLIVPDDKAADADYEVGAYAQGRGTPWTQNQLSALRGHAYYSGKATGLLHRGNEIQGLSGKARLTASFQSGTLEGDIKFVNSGVLGYQSIINTRISLRSTSFSSGGFSSDAGDAQSTYGQVISADPEDQTYLEGKWGARFYGRAQGQRGVPSSVAGTFAVTGTTGLTDFDTVSIVGAFGANETEEY